MKHTELIERLKSLTGPDREVDRIIDHTVLWPEEAPLNLELSIRDEWPVPPYTASFDAAIALTERLLPGCDICWQDLHADFRQAGEARHIAEVMHDHHWVTHDGFPEPVYATAASGKATTRPIALLIATLRAQEDR